MNLLEDYNDKMKPFSDIVKAAFACANWFKKGLHEDVYEVGLLCELQDMGYITHQQKEFPVYYKNRLTEKKFRMDLVVETPRIGNIILELKALNAVDDKHRHQLWSYMRLTKTNYGMLINFSPKGVYTERYEYDPVTNSCHKFTI